MHLRKIPFKKLLFLFLVILYSIELAQAGEQITLSPDGGHSNQIQINAALEKASQGALKGVLGVEHKELVSIDYNGNPLSSIVDLASTLVIGGKTAKVLSWYDNESGFSHRMIDLAKYMAGKGL